jgi:hypothetical protein
MCAMIKFPPLSNLTPQIRRSLNSRPACAHSHCRCAHPDCVYVLCHTHVAFTHTRIHLPAHALRLCVCPVPHARHFHTHSHTPTCARPQTVCMSCPTRTSLSRTLAYPYLRTPPDCVYVLFHTHVASRTLAYPYLRTPPDCVYVLSHTHVASRTLAYPYLRTPPDCVYVLQKKHVVIKGGHIIYNADILRPKSVLRHDINPSLLHKLNMLDLPRLLARRGP